MSGSLAERWEDIAARWERVANGRERQWQKALARVRVMRAELVRLGCTDPEILGQPVCSLEMSKATPAAFTGVKFVPVNVTGRFAVAVLAEGIYPPAEWFHDDADTPHTAEG